MKSWNVIPILCLLACATDAFCDTLGQTETLTSGRCALTISTNPQSGRGLKIWLPAKADGTTDFKVANPMGVQVLDREGGTISLDTSYNTILRIKGALRCEGTIPSVYGTAFDFTDTYSAGPQEGTFIIDREVTVRKPDAHDAGFRTSFTVDFPRGVSLREQEIFVPGVRYPDNTPVPALIPANAPTATPGEGEFLIREDRMAMPLVMLRNRINGTTITLTHCNPDGATSAADDASGNVVDARIQVASLGVLLRPDPELTLCYPSIEGERGKWTERFHPVQAGAKQSYKIMIALDVTPDFPAAMRHAWRAAYAQKPPPIAGTNIAANYEAGIKLISDWSQTTNGSSGIPFRLLLPKGELQDKSDVNFQMGFVGQQLPLAYQLLRYGLLRHDKEALRKGGAMVDFWAANSLTADGLPRTWYDVFPEPHWRPYPTYLRVATDGMAGALMAWDIMQANGHPKPEWLRFCRSFGDWLVLHQNPDGSWYREYGLQSQPMDMGKQNTTHPIRFLVDLGKATGERKYTDAALRAGEYCYANVHQTFTYVGGTVDNPNVIDKEAGFKAMDAFLALHDLDGAKRWLDAAAQAGDFTETWVYCWNVPIPADDRAATFPKGCTTTGFSLIATGQSGADLFMAAAPFLYYRLYLETGDAHYAAIARQLLYNTRQAVDINGSLGYGHTSLCSEALSLAPPRGHGVNYWLPWLTWAMLEPVARLQDAYGITDIPAATAKVPAGLAGKDAEFARTRGLLTLGKNTGAPAASK